MMYEVRDLLYILIVAGILLVLDIAWLFFMKNTFYNLIMNIQKSSFKLKIIPAVITYILLTLGLYHFIIKDRRNIFEAVLLGLFVYGVYEGTNLAIFDNWTLETTILDFIWGGVLFGSTTGIFYLIKDNTGV